MLVPIVEMMGDVSGMEISTVIGRGNRRSIEILKQLEISCSRICASYHVALKSVILASSSREVRLSQLFALRQMLCQPLPLDINQTNAEGHLGGSFRARPIDAGRITTMQRRQLLEIHDQPWCPHAVRDGATDVLKLIAVIGRQFNGAVEPLHAALAATGDRYIVDLCSGGGGPWLGLYCRIHVAGRPPIVVLTDRFPNRDALEEARRRSGGQLQSVGRPVDATVVPADLPGFRTLFTAFHHFDPPTATAVLQNAVDARQGIAVFEQTQRSIFAILFMLVLAPLAFLAVPLLRPLRWSRLFWTYLIPAIPLVLLFDGIVSCLRTYSEAELMEMTAKLSGPHYRWTYGRARTLLSPLGITWLIGYPSAADGEPTVRASVDMGPRVAAYEVVGRNR